MARKPVLHFVERLGCSAGGVIPPDSHFRPLLWVDANWSLNDVAITVGIPYYDSEVRFVDSPFGKLY
jgi:hypothetical protein